MYTNTTLTKKGIASKKRIMKYALSLFALKGFDAVRVDEIARKAKCNKAMIYYHFSSKKKLYQALLIDVFEDMIIQTKPVFLNPEPPIPKLRMVLSTFMDRYNNNCEFIQLMVREILANGKNLTGKSKDLMKTFFSSFLKVIQEGQKSGHIVPGNPVLVYRMLIGSVAFYFITRPMPRIILNIESIETQEMYQKNKRFILNMLTRGITHEK